MNWLTIRFGVVAGGIWAVATASSGLYVPDVTFAAEINSEPSVDHPQPVSPIGPQPQQEGDHREPGQQPSVGSFRAAGTTLLDDVKYIVTAPLRMDLESGLITAGVAGAIGGLMLVDADIVKFMKRNQSAAGDNAANVIDTLKTAVAPVNAGLAGLGYLFRHHEAGNKLFQTSLIGLEAQGLASGIAYLGKWAIGRNRPSRDPQGNSYDPFSNFGQSFPSGSTTQLFAFAAVFSEAYPQPAPLFFYALAAAVGLERLYSDKHFASDVLAGAVLGYVVGKALVWRHTSEKGLSIVPLDVAGAGVAIRYRF